jgi:hypothetical protein
MATRIYPAPKWLNADATAAWFRHQMSAHPRLFQPRRVPIRTWPTKERDASHRAEWQKSHGFSDPGTEEQCQAARSQTEKWQTRILSAEEIKNLLRRHMLKHCADRSRRYAIAAIAAMADVSRKLLYLIVHGRRSHPAIYGAVLH